MHKADDRTHPRTMHIAKRLVDRPAANTRNEHSFDGLMAGHTPDGQSTMDKSPKSDKPASQPAEGIHVLKLDAHGRGLVDVGELCDDGLAGWPRKA